MKAFIISIILISVIIFILVFNIFYIEHLSLELIHLVDSLPKDSLEEEFYNENKALIEKIYQLWDKNEVFVSMSVNYVHILTTRSELLDMYHYYITKSAPDYAAARASFRSAIDRIHMFEGIHFENVL